MKKISKDITTIFLIFILSCFFLIFFYILDTHFFPYKNNLINETKKIVDCTYKNLSNYKNIKIVDDINYFYYGSYSFDVELVKSNAFINLSKSQTLICESKASLKIYFILPPNLDNVTQVNSVMINSALTEDCIDWSSYSFLNFNLYSDGNMGSFSYIVYDNYGNTWTYTNDYILLDKGWHYVKIPLKMLYFSNSNNHNIKKHSLKDLFGFQIRIQQNTFSLSDKKREIAIENIYLSKK